ncbi:hypothetical protein CY35_09G049700 [Sphagnum magellanicum]|nr:hypothetical protein CY35_09G049700 [Sphagnum magellanicum]KAH9552164.1 hypothetical protein CY35_09G049700 [Sphagnum magellanicum]
MNSKGMDFGRFVSLPVVVVLLIMGFVYHTVVVRVIQPWLSLSTASGLANAMLLTALCIMAMVSYALAVIQDPGRVPSSYLPDLEDSAIILHEVKRKGGDLRYCQKCGHYKPPRAHHCRVCRRCVLRMDHHCVWINNCVGHNNYKVFFLFVLYLVAASLQSLVLLGSHAIQELGGDLPGVNSPPVDASSATSVFTVKVICTIVVLGALVTVGLLLAWHVYLLLHNKTTIEKKQASIIDTHMMWGFSPTLAWLWGTVLPAGSVQQQQVILALVCNFGHSVMTLLILSNHSLMVE